MTNAVRLESTQLSPALKACGGLLADCAEAQCDIFDGVSLICEIEAYFRWHSIQLWFVLPHSPGGAFAALMPHHQREFSFVSFHSTAENSFEVAFASRLSSLRSADELRMMPSLIGDRLSCLRRPPAERRCVAGNPASSAHWLY